MDQVADTALDSAGETASNLDLTSVAPRGDDLAESLKPVDDAQKTGSTGITSIVPDVILDMFTSKKQEPKKPELPSGKPENQRDLEKRLRQLRSERRRSKSLKYIIELGKPKKPAEK